MRERSASPIHDYTKSSYLINTQKLEEMTLPARALQARATFGRWSPASFPHPSNRRGFASHNASPRGFPAPKVKKQDGL